MKKSSEYTFIINEKTITCVIRRSRRSKHIRLTVRHDNSLLVTMPHWAHVSDAERLIENHRDWISRRLQKLQQQQQFAAPFTMVDGAILPTPYKRYTLKLSKLPMGKSYWICNNNIVELHLPKLSKEWVIPGVICWYRHFARQLLRNRVGFWAEKMNVAPRLIRVKNQHTVWGSCSKKNNINFNWRTMLLTLDTLDYLIIHELAHLRELNHSINFWQLVEQFCPDYKKCKKELREKNHWLGFPENTV